ncbi:hypothetical protein TBR22_A00430 [Luteitalea sp. TBR-22]|uniref:sensor histidine kinase n=1 Tax=Luteitalea sp. TBR-22 TaxID=2802971 RepID=UPI001AF0B254|nr:HAMP domain-containing sensor histidine kinase [Luteitalea sp. TBR-22]BCS30843.1 hypothetical protein TBR22_A00430 [Luteitalea sp. TBR-22]
MPLRQRSLAGGLLATSLIVSAVLLWSGWRLVTQQRELDARQARQAVEAAADALAADIREALAEQGDRLSARLDGDAGQASPAGTVTATWRAGLDRQVSSGGLPFVPWPTSAAGQAHVFADAEAAEFRQGTLDTAAQRYRSLAAHPDDAVRAGALLRLARVLRKQGDIAGAMTASEALAALGDEDAEGVPASLAGLDGQRLALTLRGDGTGARRVADDIRARLDAGRWMVDRGTADFYRDEVSDIPRPETWLLAAAVAETWTSHGGPPLPARGLATLAPGGRSVLVAWRANADGAAFETTFADRFVASASRDDIAWRLADADGRHLAGAAGPLPVGTVDRVIGGGSSWLLRAWALPGAATSRGRQEPLLIAATAGTVLFVWAAAGLMARALTREARVAQLQTDFVAAVSHEFRSPLTTMRQMAEMLESDRVPDEARRKQYYAVLAGETTRLQRLVERLLDFGQMEAGQGAIRRERLDLAALVDDVVKEMRPSAEERGGRIDVACDGVARVEADAASLRVAIRNLVENAVKYSPATPAVTVRIAADRGHASVAISDRGLGIPRNEQRAIFGKFVRGRGAVAARVQGTGVGLAAVKHVVDAHGGRIDVESEPGRGSTFTIRLPLTARDSEA